MSTAASIARGLSQAQRDLVLGLTTDRKVTRPGIAGRDYHLTPVNLAGRLARLRFSEGLVAEMVREGLLYVTQATGALPGLPEGRPFSARLSKLGFEVRAVLVDQL